jgi:hypothetical protein
MLVAKCGFQSHLPFFLISDISYEREKDLSIKSANFVKSISNYKPNFQTVASFQTQKNSHL